ncbi:unnamed protein product [Pedinophyceae sp. YPF-701]|nr:unnamed protein product [Pedinophyceae sp. YPF-701]
MAGAPVPEPWCSAVPAPPEGFEAKGRSVGFEVNAEGTCIGGYIAGEPQAGPEGKPTAAVVLLPDVFGWRDPWARRLADDLAAQYSCLVAVPDVQRGNVIDEVVADAFLALHASFQQWWDSHEPERVVRDALGVAQNLRWGGATRVAVVGMGWSGEYAALAAATVGAAGAELVDAFCAVLPERLLAVPEGGAGKGARRPTLIVVRGEGGEGGVERGGGESALASHGDGRHAASRVVEAPAGVGRGAWARRGESAAALTKIVGDFLRQAGVL